MKVKIKFVIILFIIMSSVYFINNTKSRFLSELNVEDNVEIAVPQIVLAPNKDTTNYTILPGDTLSYDFYIKNYDNERTNEILMTYYIKLNIIKQEIPATCKLYEVDGKNEIELNKTDEGYGPMTLDYDKPNEKHYKIVFTWDKKDNEVSYASKNIQFNIEIVSTQVV